MLLVSCTLPGTFKVSNTPEDYQHAVQHCRVLQCVVELGAWIPVTGPALKFLEATFVLGWRILSAMAHTVFNGESLVGADNVPIGPKLFWSATQLCPEETTNGNACDHSWAAEAIVADFRAHHSAAASPGEDRCFVKVTCMTAFTRIHQPGCCTVPAENCKQIAQACRPIKTMHCQDNALP